MKTGRFCVMGAGVVGFHLARTLTQEQHEVVLIDTDGEQRARIEDELDLSLVIGNGAQPATLERAGVKGCDLFIAASDSEEANLAASVMAKELGAQRTAVRLTTTEDLTTYRRVYERLFRADLLLSPQVLATNTILNFVLGHNTHEVDYLARGRVQLRAIEVQSESPLTRCPLRDVRFPEGSKMVGYLDDQQALTTPTPELVARPGGTALVLCRAEATTDVERLFASRHEAPGTVVVVGGGSMGLTLARFLIGQVRQVKLIERDAKRARRIAEELVDVEVIHADATDISVLRSEHVGDSDCLIAATGHDENNLMAALIAEELGTRRVIAVIERSETSRLWDRIDTVTTVSPRFLAADHIRDYIRHGYKPNLVRIADGALNVVQRVLHSAAPVVGATLSELNAPNGLIVGAVVRGDQVFLPRSSDRLLDDDQVILFVHESAEHLVHLLFPGSESEVVS